MKRGKTRNAARLGVMWIALMLLVGLLANSPEAGQPWKVMSLGVPGADGKVNNVAMVYDRYIIFAPNAPLKMPTDAADVEALDNHFVYVADSKKLSYDLRQKSIETLTGKKLYYPTKLIFDENRNTLYVRGTRFEKIEGGVREIPAIAYMRINPDDNGKPGIGEVVIIDIAAVSEDQLVDDAPDEFALAFNGDMLIFNNGASIFTYNPIQGYLYKVDIVKKEAYDVGSRINYVHVDEATNTLLVYWNNQLGEAGNVKNFTELSFYDLDRDGTMQLNKRLYPEAFAEGVSITAGSTLEILGKRNDQGKFMAGTFAVVVTSDGNLCQINLADEGVSLSLKPLYKFDSLATEDGIGGSPRILKLDASKRMMGIIKQGYEMQARKPTNGRRGRPGSVIRTLSRPVAVESPSLIVARLGKNSNKVISSRDFANDLFGETGLTRLIDGEVGQWLLSTHSGKVLALSTGDKVDSMRLDLLTEVGERTEEISYFNSRAAIVAINSFDVDEPQQQISQSGALVVARRTVANTQSYSVSSASTVTSNRTAVAQGPTLSARRPCNISKR